MSDLSSAKSSVFVWPMPPYAAYPASAELLADEPCEVVGLNGHVLLGQLKRIDAEQSTVYVLIPPARSPMALRFEHFRSILLRRVLRPVMDLHEVGLDSDWMNTHQPVSFSVKLHGDEMLQGQTVGHVAEPVGLFLFPPADEQGGVMRMLVPAPSLLQFDIGQRIGEVLMASRVVTQEQVHEAVQEQARLRGQKLGDILLNNQVLTPAQLLLAIEQQARMPMVRIGEALMALGMITQAQLDSALQQQQQDKSVPLGEVLVRLNMVSRQDVRVALARKMGYPLVDLLSFPLEDEAMRKIPYSIATRAEVMPVLLNDTTLVVAMNDPSDRRVLSELSFISQCRIAPVLATQTDMTDLRTEAYRRMGADVSGPMLASMPSQLLNLSMEPEDPNALVANLEKEGQQNLNVEEDDKPIEQSDNSLVRLINTMIIEAHQQGVSDIHVETYPGKEKVKIRFRKDGVLHPYLELPSNYRSALVARIKIMCDLDISERRKPQDGKINFSKFVAQHKLELRVASIPTNNGVEDIVMRLLASAKPLPLDKIGLSEWNLAKLQEAMHRPYGMVLCVGPTGSGKTTTLHSALSFINSPERKIWTAEDPVEITQTGLRQVQVNPKIDWTFAKALRAFLRADPDVIMVGEMRDIETAHMGIEASLTGHLVLSTLHTNSAPETVTRLLDMGMDPFNFADSLLVVLAQRLVKRLCTQCRESVPASDEFIDELLDDYLHNCPAAPEFDRGAVKAGWLTRFARDGQLVRYQSRGCAHCHQTGYTGRAGIHELMTVTRTLRRLIQTGARSEELLAQAMLDGMRTLRQDGLEKVLAGVTSLEEVRATSNV
jgi:type II secretory ATPase GspE/PulE/Tfp pilus assembly ATPase PilB-like protein